jgi:hypothetical protein
MNSLGLDSIANLPKGISSPAFKQGYIFGADQKYDSMGDLYNIADLNSIELNVANLKAIEPDIKKLETAMNKFGQNGLGSTLHLGVLKVTAEPTVHFSAPMFGHGISDRWMVGVGIPVVRYTNRLSFIHSGSNIDELKRQFYGVSDSIDEAFDRLDQDLIPVAQQTLREKGYKSLETRNQTFIGDVQIASFYLLHKDSTFGLRWQTLVNLPTGPQDDPDDLADLNIFGRTSWENYLVSNLHIWKDLVLAVKGGFKWAIPDRVKARVPLNSNDTLPGSDRLSIVDRDIGDSLLLGSSLTYTIHSGFGAGFGLTGNFKQTDSYAGTLMGDYGVLSRDTDSYSISSIYELSYDTVSLYFSKKALIPMILSMNFSDTIRGKNVQRLTQTEMTATLFF